MSGLLVTSAQAQSAATEKKATVAPKTLPVESATVNKASLDTEESFKFLGNQLLFQVKKRLNLTTEEEEKKQSKSTENKKFSFFGIEIERE
jgi:hypothetical protein